MSWVFSEWADGFNSFTESIYLSILSSTLLLFRKSINLSAFSPTVPAASNFTSLESIFRVTALSAIAPFNILISDIIQALISLSLSKS